MSTKKPNVHSAQDMPPKGGYPKINTTRGIRPRGPTGWLIWATVFTMSAFGFYKIGISGEQNRINRKEKRECRMAVLPFLQAEKDVEMAKRVKKILDEAHEMMKNGKDLKMGESLKSKDEDSKDKDSKDKSS